MHTRCYNEFVKGGEPVSLDDRSKNILDELVSHPSVTSTTLENKYELTRRQLGYSFNKINDWLQAKNLPVIERTRKGHFIIDQAVFTTLNGEEESELVDPAILNEDQRVYLITMMLLEQSGRTVAESLYGGIRG